MIVEFRAVIGSFFLPAARYGGFFVARGYAQGRKQWLRKATEAEKLIIFCVYPILKQEKIMAKQNIN